ncbi:MAG: hypothetical protein Q7S83_00805 [bacterium]|nr:hypothetical protein [bacterium]
MNQKGFPQLILMVVVVVVVVAGGGIWYYQKSAEQNKPVSEVQVVPESPSVPTEQPKQQVKEQEQPQTTEVLKPSEKPVTQETTNNNSPISPYSVIWNSKDFTWYPNGTPPACPQPLTLKTPVDMQLVTGALWPGQVRGGYKAHGGFRFNNDGTNDITVRAPVGSHLIQASQYLEGGEKQYFFVFSVPCGFVYRLDHARVLSVKLSEAVKNLPPATEGDSRTSYINPPVWVDAGEVVATSIGVTKNIFVDFGLYDVRKPNNVTPNPAWADLYAADKEFGHYGVCFFDYLSGNDGTTMRSLPTGKEGKVSDYCK